MKTFMKYLLAVTVSLIVGGILGWQAFSYRVRLHTTTPFDWEPYYSWHVDLCGHDPYIELNFAPEGNTFNWRGKTGRIEEDLDSHLARIANFTTSCWIIVSCNSDVTVQQVRDIDARIRKFGFAKPGILIEGDRDNQTEGKKRLFNEIRIGPSMDFDWYQIEWFINAVPKE